MHGRGRRSRSRRRPRGTRAARPGRPCRRPRSTGSSSPYSCLATPAWSFPGSSSSRASHGRRFSPEVLTDAAVAEATVAAGRAKRLCTVSARVPRWPPTARPPWAATRALRPAIQAGRLRNLGAPCGARDPQGLDAAAAPVPRVVARLTAPLACRRSANVRRGLPEIPRPRSQRSWRASARSGTARV